MNESVLHGEARGGSAPPPRRRFLFDELAPFARVSPGVGGSADAGPADDDLRERVVTRATLARKRYGPLFDELATPAMLLDRDVVRFPTRLRFAALDRRPDELARVRSIGARPADGVELVLHPRFDDRWDVLPLVVAYSLASISDPGRATSADAELFGATLLATDVAAYYDELCRLADALA